MKKLITILIILFASSLFAQDTCKKYVITNFRKPNQKVDTVYYLCDTVKSGNKVTGDKVTKAELRAGGMQDTTQTLTAEEQEVLYFAEQIQKIETQMQELERTKQQLIGVLTYTQKKYNIDLQSLIKRVQK